MLYNSDSKVSALTISAGGAPSAATTRDFFVYTQPTVYQDGKAYTADATGVNVMELSTGGTSQIVNSAGITEIDVVGADVFFETPSGVYKRASTGDVELYSAAPVDIEAVIE